MEEQETKSIYEQAIVHFGLPSQEDKLIEEMSELMQAILKFRRNPCPATCDNLHEEFVDVEIVMAQIKTTLDETLLHNKGLDKRSNLIKMIY
jgi:NTP pyrophosphatase (non-canonical NTP hydrolase)